MSSSIFQIQFDSKPQAKKINTKNMILKAKQQQKYLRKLFNEMISSSKSKNNNKNSCSKSMNNPRFLGIQKLRHVNNSNNTQKKFTQNQTLLRKKKK